MKKLVILISILFASCNNDHKSVKMSKLECYSGSVKYFEYIGENKVFILNGGFYKIVSSKTITTLTGDCVLSEEF